MRIHLTRFGRRAPAGVIAMALLLCAPAAQAQPQWENRVLVVTTGSDGAKMGELRDVLSAHFEDLAVKVELAELRLPYDDTVEQVFSVRDLMQSKQAISAIWVDHKGKRVFLMGANASSQKVILTFAGSRESWPVMCDTIAALVSSAVITWLENAPVAPAPPVQTSWSQAPRDTPGQQSRAAWNRPIRTDWSRPTWQQQTHWPRPSEVTLKSKEKEETWIPDRESEVHMELFSGYNLGSVSRDESLSHGMRVGLGVLLHNTVEFGMSVRFIQPLHIRAESDVIFRRIPIDFRFGWIWFTNRFDWGIRAGVVMDVTIMEGGGTEISGLDKSRTHTGFAPSVVARYYPHRLLAVFAETGADIYFTPDLYKWSGQTVFEYGAVQPYMTLGIVLVLGSS